MAEHTTPTVGAVDPASAAAALVALANAAKSAAPDTSKAPPNVSDEDIRREVTDKATGVRKAVATLEWYAQQQGWRTRVQEARQCFKVWMWPFTEGQGPMGEEPPKNFASETPGEALVAAQKEVAAQRSEIERLNRALNKANSRISLLRDSAGPEVLQADDEAGAGE